MASPTTTSTVTLNDGTTMPTLAFGSGTRHRNTDASPSILSALHAGFRHIDCASMYANESSVGRALAASGIPRASVYITTKLDKLPPGWTVRDALLESLERLQSEYVDMYLVHVPIVHEDLKAVWRDMEACRAEGLARSIGVSNFTQRYLEQIVEIATVLPTVNQIELHPYVFKASTLCLEYMKKQGILATSYGGLTPIARFPDGPVDPVLCKITERLRITCGKPVTPAQVSQLWLRKKGIPYVTTTESLERMNEYLDTLLLLDLTEKEEQEIDEAGAKIHHRVVCAWIDSEA